MSLFNGIVMVSLSLAWGGPIGVKERDAAGGSVRVRSGPFTCGGASEKLHLK